MERIQIYASTDYEVVIGTDLLDKVGDYIADALKMQSGFDSTTAVVVSDDNVFPLYGERLKKALSDKGFKTIEFVFPHGEKSKSLALYGELQ